MNQCCTTKVEQLYRTIEEKSNRIGELYDELVISNNRNSQLGRENQRLRESLQNCSRGYSHFGVHPSPIREIVKTKVVYKTTGLGWSVIIGSIALNIYQYLS